MKFMSDRFEDIITDPRWYCGIIFRHVLTWNSVYRASLINMNTSWHCSCFMPCRYCVSILSSNYLFVGLKGYGRKKVPFRIHTSTAWLVSSSVLLCHEIGEVYLRQLSHNYMLVHKAFYHVKVIVLHKYTSKVQCISAIKIKYSKVSFVTSSWMVLCHKDLHLFIPYITAL